MASATVEGYVKAVYRLSLGDDRPVTTGQLADDIKVSPGTVTSMLKTLHASELATYTPYEGVRLTESGKRMALGVIRRQGLLESFLSQALGLDCDKVHDDAELMAHYLSDFLVEQIDEQLGHPKYDLHGDPIPRADETKTALPRSTVQHNLGTYTPSDPLLDSPHLVDVRETTH